MFDKLAEAVNGDHNLVLRGKTCSLTLLIEIDNDEYFIDIVSGEIINCLLYTSPSPRDQRGSRMPSSA